MCGIFGIICLKEEKSESIKSEIKKLFLLSESRGKEAAGLAILYNNNINIIKENIAASDFIKTKKYSDFISNNLNSSKTKGSFCVMGHSRLVTNGSDEINENNQPVVKDGIVGIHNGICVNVDVLYSQHSEINRKYEVDTELILSLLKLNLLKTKDIIQSVKLLFEEIEGTASLALFFEELNKVILTTNNASLYFTSLNNETKFYFASEESILDKFCVSQNIVTEIKRVEPKSIVIFDLSDNNESFKYIKNYEDVEEIEFKPFNKINYKNSSIYKPIEKVINTDYSFVEYNIDTISKLKRCSNCILPETFPCIDFDQDGVCNFCRAYKPRNQGNDLGRLNEIIDIYVDKSKTNKPNVLVPISGGRDSCFGLDFVVNNLKLKPITYTYDWGMVTDLARRNIARVCGKLGIENILVSADIRKKRRNINLNVSAWLKRPELGIIPLFMAGDKQFFSYINKVKHDTGIVLNLWSSNRLENTEFKSLFCGLKPKFDKEGIDSLDVFQKLTMGGYYFKNFILNPAYFNASIYDTFLSFNSYYFENRKGYTLLFDYIKWDEKQIEDTLINEYNWELAPDTKSTWRIGDGTAPFYNYIYYTVAGFSENDTFRSNQIREGMITREEALRLTIRDNAPRYESMKWYFDTIGVDFESAIKVINNIPKLYKEYL